MNRNLLRQILVMVFVIATIIVNGLANALPINGQQTGDISDRFDVFFVPAGYVFSIWGLIYAGLIAYAIYQILPAQRDNPRLRSIDVPFYVASLANIVWIFLWHYEFFALTMVVMVILLVSLIVIYLRLGIGRTLPPSGERWFVQLPFSVYLGWITVATVANATSLLDFVNWNGFGISEQTWFLIMLAVAVVVARVDDVDAGRRGLPAGAGVGVRRHRREAQRQRRGRNGVVGGDGRSTVVRGGGHYPASPGRTGIGPGGGGVATARPRSLHRAAYLETKEARRYVRAGGPPLILMLVT